MNSYRFAFLISVTFNMIQFSLSRELFVFNVPTNKNIVLPVRNQPRQSCQNQHSTTSKLQYLYAQSAAANIRIKNANPTQYIVYKRRLICQNRDNQNTHREPSNKKSESNRDSEVDKLNLHPFHQSEISTTNQPWTYNDNITPSATESPRHGTENTNTLSSHNHVQNTIKMLRTLQKNSNILHNLWRTKNVQQLINTTIKTNNKTENHKGIEANEKYDLKPETQSENILLNDMTYSTSNENCTSKNSSAIINYRLLNSNKVYPEINSTETLYEKFKHNVDNLERKFYKVTFDKLSANSPAGRKENGISFAQSGLFLHLVLIALSMTVDMETKYEIEKCLDFEVSETDRLEMLQYVLSMLPTSDDELKFRWSTRLILSPKINLESKFNDVKNAMKLKLHTLNETTKVEQVMNFLNNLVELDSGGAMQNTFDEEELSSGVSGVLISMLYVRARWRSAPTLLNGTRLFRDAPDATPDRTFGAIRINDVMQYAELNEWDAEAIEIPYATPGLTLLILVPRDSSLRRLTRLVATTTLDAVAGRMHGVRTAVTVPLYTLRMTLLLPSKLEAMGVTKLVDRNATGAGALQLSHAIQRIMFWSEAGRNAFKDDGIEWDEPPELELVIDRPYIFFVRWNGLTLLSGNFVL